MKMGEALALRADLNTKLVDLRRRAANNTVVQEGETPEEDANALLQEADLVSEELSELVGRIAKTNAATGLTDSLQRREHLRRQINNRRQLAQSTENTKGYGSWRSMRSELTFETKIDIPSIQSEIDRLTTEERELDIEIQTQNWTVDLV